jgi:CheY-like chemotaxis protein
MSDKAVEPRLNLSRATVLLLQNSQAELDILGQVFLGFGVKAIRKCATVAMADQAILSGVPFDLVIVDCDMPDHAGYDFVVKLRRMEQTENRLASVLLISGHTVPSSISRARDCGANFVVAKPITPKVMYDRVLWLARDRREFVLSDGYAGPDRRHKYLGPPAAVPGRRCDDKAAEHSVDDDAQDTVISERAAS